MRLGGSVIGPVARRALVIVCATAAILTTSAQPAMACSCGPIPVKEQVKTARAVYIARARLPDPMPGVSFRVTRVLKGPSRSNIRVDVQHGPSASCGTSVRGRDYVLPVDDGRLQLNLCNEQLGGAAAIKEAELVLGQGRAVPWRPDAVWLVQWLAIFGIPSSIIVAIRRERRRSRDPS